MPNFSYKAINERGVAVSGVIDADSLESANSALASRGLIPSKVIAQVKSESASTMSALLDRLIPVKTTELILFTKQFRTMLRAGVPMMTLLSTIENQTEDQPANSENTEQNHSYGAKTDAPATIHYEKEANFLILESSYLLAMNSIIKKKEERINDTIDAYYNFVDNFEDEKYFKESEHMYDSILKERDKLLKKDK